jgi:hypothetical protein|nr:MAG TPA: Heat shock factor binding protein 1 [Caudoviricetes sp.]
MEILNLIEAVGFPISAVIGLALFGNKIVTRIMDESKEREASLLEGNKELTAALKVVADTTESTAIQLNRLCDRMDTLENKIDTLEKELKN